MITINAYTLLLDVYMFAISSFVSMLFVALLFTAIVIIHVHGIALQI